MKFVVSSPPHWHSRLSEGRIHLDFILALIPAAVYALFTYGIHGARVMALAVSSAVIAEILVRKMFRREATFTNGSSFLVGLLLALLLPPTAPAWLVVVGSFLCIFIGKEIFGGLGSNPLNPVLVGWAILEISWPGHLNFNLSTVNFDLGFPVNYPLTMLKEGGAEAVSGLNQLDLLLGKQVGGIGAAAVLLLLIGGIYLLIRRVITWEIPLSFAAGTVIMSGIFWLADGSLYAGPLFHLLTGNLMIGIFFLAVDYSSSPFNRTGMIIFGLGCGFMTVILRVWSIYPDGVVYAILIMNLFTPLLDKLKKRKPAVKVSYLERQVL